MFYRKIPAARGGALTVLMCSTTSTLLTKRGPLEYPRDRVTTKFYDHAERSVLLGLSVYLYWYRYLLYRRA